MWISRKKRKENIAEYLLYMWQVEDSLRAANMDKQKVRQLLVEPYGISDFQKDELNEWYSGLVDTMHNEGIAKQGHMQVNTNLLMDLIDLHNRLLHDSAQPNYQQTFVKLHPVLSDLQKKMGNDIAEIELCFRSLYMVMLMRMSKKELQPATEEATQQIAAFISLLASNYHKRESGELEI